MKKVSLLLLVCFLTSNSNLALATSPIPSPEQQKALEIQRLKSEFNTSKNKINELIRKLQKMEKFERAVETDDEDTLKYWHLESPEENDREGISANEVSTILAPAKSGLAIVAVLDGGTNINHEALKDYVLINEKEIPNNNIDDDQNGYVDDVYGWDFVGKNINEDSLELTRQYFRCKQQKVNPVFCKKIKTDYLFQVTYLQRAVKELAAEEKKLVALLKSLQITTGEPAFESALMEIHSNSAYFQGKLDTIYSEKYVAKQTPGYSQRKTAYGSNDVIGYRAEHGTHVAGDVVLTFERAFGGKENALNHLRFFPVRTVPDGDERDEDVANAIRYAVDRGANIIQMSFGKSHSSDEGKDLVDAAVAYGHSKGVVFVHSSGNDGHRSTPENNFPNARERKTNNTFSNWIEVGNSTPIGEFEPDTGASIAAQSSNYGSFVDIFAPGTRIYSTGSSFNPKQSPAEIEKQNHEYEYMDGTSMASPVFSGSLAVLIASFPEEQPARLAQQLIRYSRHNRADQKVFFYEYLHEYNQIQKNSLSVEGKDYQVEVLLFKDASTSGNILDIYRAACKISKLSDC
jgi:subtilisin family serine protease